MIKIMEGNLFDTTAPIIAHQVNCRGVMGSGVAKQVKKKYPEAFKEYTMLCSSVPEEKLLGFAQPCFIEGKIIVNLFGQEKYGYDGKQYTSTKSLQNAFIELRKIAEWTSNDVIAMPYKIGCARGGADWDKEVFPMIRLIFLESDIDIELWKLPEGVNDNEL